MTLTTPYFTTTPIKCADCGALGFGTCNCHLTNSTATAGMPTEDEMARALAELNNKLLHMKELGWDEYDNDAGIHFSTYKIALTALTPRSPINIKELKYECFDLAVNGSDSAMATVGSTIDYLVEKRYLNIKPRPTIDAETLKLDWTSSTMLRDEIKGWNACIDFLNSKGHLK